MEQISWQFIRPAEVMEFSRQHIFTEQALEQFSSYTGAKDGIEMADIGCGTGSFTRYLRKKTGESGKITGIDSNKEYLSFAKEKTKEEKIDSGISFVLADAYELPFESESLDAVTDHTLLIHIKEPERFLKEELRVLRKGGVISTATYLADTVFPEWENECGVFEQLEKTQKKIKELLKKHVFFSDVPIGANDRHIYGIASRYRKAGVRKVEINGILSVFTPDDHRYSSIREEWLQKQYHLQAWEIQRFLNEIERWESFGLNREELELSLEQLKDRYEAAKLHTACPFATTAEIIVSGIK